MIEGLLAITNAEIEELSSSLQLNFSDNVRKNILKSMESIDVQACPGSGKTTLVAAKLALLSKKWPFQHRGICALSHTNVAKDEIIKSLKSSGIPEAQSLLSYPHFIGTIQEFVNRHLALPFLRSEGHSKITVDNDEYFEAGLRRLQQNNYLSNRLRGAFRDEGAQRGFLSKTHMIFDSGSVSVNFDALPQRWRTQNNYERAKNELSQFKRRLSQQNLFLFRDMYSYAQQSLSAVPSLSRAIATRFPLLIMDEMQDTQQFQDELLQSAVGFERPFGSVMQRFGDPDQAIFNGANGESPNVTFNSQTRDQMSFVLDGSHRYLQDIAEKIRPFSQNEIELTSQIPEDERVARSHVHQDRGQFLHTVFVFDDHSRIDVIKAFCELVSGQFSEDYLRSGDFVAKVVGAVGADVDPDEDQLRIGHYCPGFKKSNSATRQVSETLIETVRHARVHASGDLFVPYRIILGGVLKFLDLANERDINGRKYRVSTLKERLVSEARWEQFRAFVFDLLGAGFDDSPEAWVDDQRKLLAVFEMNQLADNAQDFLNYIVQEAQQNEDAPLGEYPFSVLSGNSLLYDDTVRVELSTIHGVKGETHDATLILETKNRAHDVGGMIQYFCGERPNPDNSNHDLRDNPHHTAGNAASKKFLRQLFVALSRPKHLLCIAVHRDRLPDDKRAALLEFGWMVSDVSEEGDN